MAKNPWTVAPQTTPPVNLTWKDGDGVERAFWIRLKKRLTIGESRQLANAGWSGFRPPQQGEKGEIGVDWREQQFARVLTWVTEWSLADEEERRLPLNRDTVEALDPDVFALIEEAIAAHVKAATEEKKAQSGKSEPSATSA